MLKNIILCIVTCFLCTACQKDIPDPEVKNKIVIEPMNIVLSDNEVEVGGKSQDLFSVRSHVKGEDVFVECFIPGISFTNRHTSLIVSVDGKEKKVVTTAAFIIKGLSSGSHQIQLEVVENNQKRPDMRKDFVITIP